MVFVKGDDYRALRRPGDDPAQFRSLSRLEQGVEIIDDFEDNDLSEYTKNFQVNQSDAATVKTSPVTNGNFALKYNHAQGFDSITSLQGNGLENYPTRGDKIQYSLRTPSQSLNNFQFGMVIAAQTAAKRPDGYLIGTAPARGGDIAIVKFFNGNLSVLATDNTASGLPPTTFFEIRIDFGATKTDTISAELIDNGTTVASCSTVDTTYSSGGIGFQAEPNEDFVCFADFARIIE
jgi:hypothetical protein